MMLGLVATEQREDARDALKAWRSLHFSHLWPQNELAEIFWDYRDKCFSML